MSPRVARVLVDTDVLAAHLRGEKRYDPGPDEIYVSTITRAELAAGRHTDDGQVARLIGAMTAIDVDDGIAERAGLIRRSTGVNLSDAIIAATAMEHGLTLVTHNIWSFRGIAGLDAAAPS
jgi:predicted nucleic acid-binding protein